ncbi:RNA 2',3'-cyclic phosphodiesterase [Planococcus lenghuensis]|uniref:RNA 2',3'-cyclic phosphodiesterase n=1 Tax=Planococcus lenghuensis TaxID=2213202 RepID=A0A1Q2KX47_9BACL|nr:RNA 2',3'-cyclic phosphodiesterase [Planococcus lenghuensis]AQQ52771.1 2'-5' RNA ligase [Planococcus lenghuensis]
MSSHYFIGIRLPEETAASLALQRDSWRLRSHKQLPPAEDLHITLVYIGADPNDELPDVLQALEAVDMAAFEVTVSGAGTFGNPATPRVIYADVQENPHLRELQRQVEAALEPFSLRPDKRPFVPHITLAKKWKGNDPLTEPLTIGIERFTVSEFSLFQVHLDKRPRYEAVRTYELSENASK